MARMTNGDLKLAVMNRNLKTLLESSQAFRQFVFALFTDARIFMPTHSRASPYDTAYYEGRRSLGLEVLHRLKHVRPDILSLIEREGNLLEQETSAAQPQGATDELPDPTDQFDEQDASGS